MILAPMPRDGNCLFHSLASFFQSRRITHDVLRRMIVHFVYQNAHMFEADILAEGYKSVDEYCQYMSQRNQWGDGIALQAFAMIFKVNVYLTIDNEDAEPTRLSTYDGAPNLGLLLRGNHYDRIIQY